MHEVKTPLAAAKLTLENAPGAVPASVSEDLRRIEDDLEQALFYARSNSVEKDYLIRPASLRELVNTAVRRNAKDMIASRIKLQLEPLDYTVLTDMKWVDFILNQILVNAIKYRSASPSIHIYAQQEKNSVALTIADNGIGIRAADLPRVFRARLYRRNRAQIFKGDRAGPLSEQADVRQIGDRPLPCVR